MRKSEIDLSQMTQQELMDLNRRVVERIRLLGQRRALKDLSRFSVGDTVSFHPECGHVVVGMIIRLNQKTATVMAENGHQWRVSPTFLSRVVDGACPQLLT